MLKSKLTLGYSPCPNDTFIFYALVHGRVAGEGLEFRETLHDVEVLNQMALGGELDVTKVSCHALGLLRDDYCLLRSGGAVGRGCGPLVVARERMGMDELRGRKIAVPGRLTTACLLMQLYDPSLTNVSVMAFHEIMGAVRDGRVDAGLVIHEGRFTFAQYGLSRVMDLGQWWEKTTGCPIPLGCIVARRDLGGGLVGRVEGLVRESLLYARRHPDEAWQYIKAHAQELRDDVIGRHIDLYVNDYSVDLGDDGVRAVNALLDMAERRGIIKKSAQPLFYA